MSGDMYNAIMDGDVARFVALAKGEARASDVTETEGWNYLHRALLNIRESPPLEMIDRLIAWGAELNGVDKYGNTPLFYAVRQKTDQAAQIVARLVAAGADVNVLNLQQTSPLREAISRLPISPEIVRVLLNAGADMNQKSQGGRSIREMVELSPGIPAEVKQLFSAISRT
jgi:ankyrin repeat protein